MSLKDRISRLSTVASGLRAFVRVVRQPERLDDVIAVGSALATPEVLTAITDHLRKNPTGAAGLADRPRLGPVDLEALGALPEGTLGREFHDFVTRHGIDPADLPDLPSGDEGEWVLAHLYETHDIWHVVTGFGTDVASELGLQAFYLSRFPAYLANAILAMGMINTLLFAFGDRDPRMDAITRGWLLGRRANPIVGVRWAELWDRNLVDLRRELGIDLSGVDRALTLGDRAPAEPLAA